ncbi:hypothetical protein [Ammoniphilus sp. 3BR4]|uniref:hypothetical protein n=1 Tax=Ammoniphilus sp. 3BR4 TaxID=3158265 RepID=UPI0034661FDF
MWEKRIGALIMIILFSLGAATGCSSSDERVLLTGIPANYNSIKGQDKTHQLYAEETDIVALVGNKEIDFGYVRLSSAVNLYLDGAPIVAVAASKDPNEQIWLLITHTENTRNDSQAVRKAVEEFITYSKQHSLSPIQLDEKNLRKAIHLEKKVNLSWFIDPSFQNGE